jgi:hypothetical protein
LYEEVFPGPPLPLRERDRVRGKRAATSLLIQTKNAVNHTRLAQSCRGEAFTVRLPDLGILDWQMLRSYATP